MRLAIGGGAVLAVAAVAAAGYAAWRLSKDGHGAVAAVGDAINPLNPNNVFARGADSVASQLAGRDTTLGGEIRAWVSDDDKRIQAMLNGTDAPRYEAPQWSTDRGQFNNPSAYQVPITDPYGGPSYDAMGNRNW
jgi:hypothetical protein